MSDTRRPPVPVPPSSRREVDAFLDAARAVPAKAEARGRLIFAMDATASREPTWDRATHLQSGMFQAAAGLGGLAVQLCYYRGFGEFKASGWVTDAEAMIRLMTSVFCLGGATQIAKVLRHAVAESKRGKVDALVFVGDCMEEDVDVLAALAGELGLRGVPVFLFHEGDDAAAARAFRHIAKLTKGACCPFDASSPGQLRDLLTAVAVYASGGRAALDALARQGSNRAVRLLTDQMTREG